MSNTKTIAANETRHREILRRFYNDEIRALGDPSFNELPPNQIKALGEISSFKFYASHYHLGRLITAVITAFGFKEQPRQNTITWSEQLPPVGKRKGGIVADVLHLFGFHAWKRPEIDKAGNRYKLVKKCSRCGASKIVGVLAALTIVFGSCAPGNNFKNHYNYDPARTTGRRVISGDEIRDNIARLETEYNRLEDSLQLTEKGTVTGVRIVVRQIKLLDSVEKYTAMWKRPVPVPDSPSVKRLNLKGTL